MKNFNPFQSFLSGNIERKEIKTIYTEDLSLIKREVFCYCEVCKTETVHKINIKSVICITCKHFYELNK